MNKFVAQFKREIIENKWSLVYAPLIVSTVLLVSLAVFIYYWLFVIKQPLEPDFTLKNFSIEIMYSNCALIMTLYFFLSLNYLSNCLYEDRKNKQILFWRSMPVSETFAVVVKILVVMLFLPLMITVINLLMTTLSFLVGTIYLSLLDIGPVIDSASESKANPFTLPFEILKDNMFGMLFVFPFIGYFLLMSTLVKRFPLIIALAVPSMIVYVDFLLDKVGLTIGVMDLCKQYFFFWQDVGTTFVLREPFDFRWDHMGAILIGIVIGIGFTAGSIWLRNNRYEI